MANEARAGGCHCGAVRYEAAVDLEKPVIACNCSICQAKGLMLTFIPFEALRVTAGEDRLTTYRFNSMTIAHQFCPTCGVECFGRAEGEKGGAAINVRTLDKVNLDELTVQPYNGRDR